MKFTGTIYRDPEMTWTKTGKALVKVPMQNDADDNFYTVQIWEERAEVFMIAHNERNLFPKGTRIEVDGYVKKWEWTDRNGNPHVENNIVSATIRRIKE